MKSIDNWVEPDIESIKKLNPKKYRQKAKKTFQQLKVFTLDNGQLDADEVNRFMISHDILYSTILQINGGARKICMYVVYKEHIK